MGKQLEKAFETYVRRTLRIVDQYREEQKLRPRDKQRKGQKSKWNFLASDEIKKMHPDKLEQLKESFCKHLYRNCIDVRENNEKLKKVLDLVIEDEALKDILKKIEFDSIVINKQKNRYGLPESLIIHLYLRVDKSLKKDEKSYITELQEREKVFCNYPFKGLVLQVTIEQNMKELFWRSNQENFINNYCLM